VIRAEIQRVEARPQASGARRPQARHKLPRRPGRAQRSP
jgi:hypothetical protein